ncbi:hypothetical protein ACTQ43_07925 [Segatella copri]|uniref:hypothetical protein n=1 Tax=Segatella copri TaxID=165179 RepID=UPI003F99F5D3
MDWISKQAKLYRNLALTHRYQAIVHLEDQEDERFWDYQLQHVKPGRYRYLYYSKNNNGTDTRGCENGKEYLSVIKSRFEEELKNLSEQPTGKIESLTEENAYLHIQGHLLYKMILHIGTLLCRGTGVAFKTDILDNSLHTNGYDEIEALQKDLHKILIQ